MDFHSAAAAASDSSMRDNNAQYPSERVVILSIVILFYCDEMGAENPGRERGEKGNRK